MPELSKYARAKVFEPHSRPIGAVDGDEFVGGRGQREPMIEPGQGDRRRFGSQSFDRPQRRAGQQPAQDRGDQQARGYADGPQRRDVGDGVSAV